MLKYAVIIAASILGTILGIHYAHSKDIAPFSVADKECISPEQNLKEFPAKGKVNGVEIKLSRVIGNPNEVKRLREHFAEVAQEPVDNILEFDRLDVWISSAAPDTDFIVAYNKGCQVKINMVPDDEWKSELKGSGLEQSDS